MVGSIYPTGTRPRSDYETVLSCTPAVGERDARGRRNPMHTAQLGHDPPERPHGVCVVCGRAGLWLRLMHWGDTRAVVPRGLIMGTVE